MSASRKLAAAMLGVFVLGACAKEEPAPAVIMPEQTYNKFGEPMGCVDDQGSSVPCMPEQGCDSTAAGANCVPGEGGGNNNTPGTTG